jgi:hypothetical protein
MELINVEFHVLKQFWRSLGGKKGQVPKFIEVRITPVAAYAGCAPFGWLKRARECASQVAK